MEMSKPVLIKTTSMKKKILTSNIICLPKIFKNERKVFKSKAFKLFWMFCFICSIIGCTSILAITLNNYSKHAVLTTIDIIKKNPIEFPTITFCDLNPTIKKYKLEDKIINCTFNQLKNCLNDFTIFYDNYLSSYCYQFNSSLYSSSRSGIHNGLVVRLFSSIFTEPRNHSSFNTDVSNGFQVFIHNKSSFATRDEGLILQTGEAIYLSIKKVINTRLTEPFNDCIKSLETYKKFNSTLYEMIRNMNITYRQKDCLDNAYMLESNNCFDSFSKCISNQNINSYYLFYENKLFEKYISSCPEECDSIRYIIGTSHGSYPTYTEYLSLLKNTQIMALFPKKDQTPINEIKESLLTVYIFFEDMEYTFISQHAKTELWDLISSIGGLFGLFLGFSFLSLMDIFQILLEISFILFEKKTRGPEMTNL
jgi:hypothetical protein